MFGRVHTVTTPEHHDRELEIVRDRLLPWLRDSTGFCGMIRLAHRSQGDGQDSRTPDPR